MYQQSDERMLWRSLPGMLGCLILFVIALAVFGTSTSAQQYPISTQYECPFVLRWNGFDGGVIIQNTSDEPITVERIQFYDGLYPGGDKTFEANDVVMPRRHVAYTYSMLVENGFGHLVVTVKRGRKGPSVMYTMSSQLGNLSVMVAKEVTSR